MRRQLLLCAAALGFASACSSDHPQAEPTADAATATVFDSAGIRIIDLGATPHDLAAPQTLACTPDLVVRGREDDASYVLSDVRDVELPSGGRVAVANGNEILLFDSAGHHVARWGGTGDGPGEFRRLDWLAFRAPDSLVAADIALRRITVLDARGQFVRSFETASAVDPAARPVPPRPMGLLADGSVIAAFFEQPAPEEGTSRPGVEIVGIPKAGTTVHTIGTWPGEELALFQKDGFLEVTQPPFGRRLQVASAHDGVWIGDDAQWEIRKYSVEGNLRSLVRSAESPSPVSDRLLEEWISLRYRYASQVPALEELKRDQRQIAHHTTTPSFGTLLAASDGGVAIGEFGIDMASSRAWIKVDPNGTVTATDLPAGLDVKRWKQDRVIGVARDELGREEIHGYTCVPD